MKVPFDCAAIADTSNCLKRDSDTFTASITDAAPTYFQQKPLNEELEEIAWQDLKSTES